MYAAESRFPALHFPRWAESERVGVWQGPFPRKCSDMGALFRFFPLPPASSDLSHLARSLAPEKFAEPEVADVWEALSLFITSFFLIVSCRQPPSGLDTASSFPLAAGACLLGVAQGRRLRWIEHVSYSSLCDEPCLLVGYPVLSPGLLFPGNAARNVRRRVHNASISSLRCWPVFRSVPRKAQNGTLSLSFDGQVKASGSAFAAKSPAAGRIPPRGGCARSAGKDGTPTKVPRYPHTGGRKTRSRVSIVGQRTSRICPANRKIRGSTPASSAA